MNLFKYTAQNSKRPLILLVLFFCPLFLWAQQPYITIWKTDKPGASQNNQIIIPASGAYTYTWQEVNNPAHTGSGSGAGVDTLTFPAPGKYQVEMTPTGNNPFHRITFHNNDDKEKLLKITQWGSVHWSSFKNAYKGVKDLKITAADSPDLDSVTNMVAAFSHTDHIEIDSINNWDVSNVKNMSRMFFNSIFNQPLNDWDVSNVRNMERMFALSNFNQPIESWDVSAVTDMSWMFCADTVFNQPLNSWDVGNVKDMTRMFKYALAFNQPLDDWDVSQVESMYHMFDMSPAVLARPIQAVTQTSNTAHFNQSLGNWDLNSLNSATSMFYLCPLSCENYSLTLQGWAGNPNTPTHVHLGAIGLKYSPDVADSRAYLINGLGWGINDAGQGTCSMGVEKQGFISVKIYPNPTTSILNLQSQQPLKNYVLYDLSGRQIESGRLHGTQIDLSNLESGMYLLSLKAENGSQGLVEVVKK